jgi:hypothetical protein
MKLKFPAQGSISENKKKSVMIIFLHLHESFCYDNRMRRNEKR